VLPDSGIDRGRRGPLRALLATGLAFVLAAALAPSAFATVTITEHSTGITADSGPDGVAPGPDGSMWFTQYKDDQIGRIAADGSVTEYPSSGPAMTAGAAPSQIVEGSDGNLWFTEYGIGEIGELSPGTGQLVGEYPLPAGATSEPEGITVGPDGALWFTERGAGQVGRLDIAAATPGTSDGITEYPVGTSVPDRGSTEPVDLVDGPDGALWVTLLGTAAVDRIDTSAVSPGTLDGVTNYVLPAASSAPEGITVGPDNAVWIADYGAGELVRVDTATVVSDPSDAITDYPAGGTPLWISSAGDGGLWFTDNGADEIVRFDPSTHATQTYGSGQGVTGDATADAQDASGNLWFTEFDSDRVGEATTAPPRPPPPVNDEPPIDRTAPSVVTIAGPAGYVSQIRSCDSGTWTGSPTFTYQWLRNGTAIAGATSSGYVFTSADDGQRLACQVTATNAYGHGTATSAAITVPSPDTGGLPPVGYPTIPKPPPRLGRPVKTLVDPQLQGIEVTQGTQASQYSGYAGFVNAVFPYPFYAGDGLPYPAGPLGPGGLTTQYQGVTLVSGGPTYVRVFVADRDGPGLSIKPLAGVTVSLQLAVQTAGGFLKPPAALQPQLIYAEPSVGPGSNVAYAERTDPNDGYVFTIPQGLWAYFQQAHGTSLTLTANLYAPETDTTGQCADAQCSENDTFTMTGIGPFLPPTPLLIQTVALGPPGYKPGPFSSTFGSLQRMYPGGYDFTFKPPGGNTVDTSSVDGLHLTSGPGNTTVVLASNNTPTNVCGTPVPTTAALLDNCRIPLYMQLLTQWVNQHAGAPTGVTPGNRATALYDLVVGVLTGHRSATPSTSALGVLTAELQAASGPFAADPATVAPYAYVDDSRPVGAVAHEFGHELGLIHAGQNCPGLAGSGANEAWLPDNTGELQSYGFDVTSVLSPIKGVKPLPHFQVFPPTDFDVMSYCGSDSTKWLSAQNWERTIHTLADYYSQLQVSLAAAAKARAQDSMVRAAAHVGARAAGTASMVGVYGVITGGQATITDVAPLGPAPMPTPANDVGLSLRSLGAGGAVLAQTPVTVAHLHVDGGDPTTATFVGEAPAGVETLQVVSGGAVIGSRARPAHGPSVTLAAPKPRTRVGAGGLRVSWRESEPGGPQLLASVDVSTDGGTSWNNVADALTRTTTTIPADALPASRRGRIRVRVSDGFAQAAAVSGPLRFPGTAPAVTITSVVPGVALRSDRSAQVYGEAIDETGRVLTGGALRWYLGGRLLGMGSALSLTDLAPGRHVLMLRARGHTGRIGVATVTLRITAEAPAFTVLSAPASVPRSARSMVVAVQASEPATLHAGSRRFAVGVRRVRLRIPLTRRGAIAGAELVLSAYGRRSSATVAVVRG
jgi:virginiamycin B lyase